MAWAATPRRSKSWNTRWNPEVLKEEIRQGHSLRWICRRYATRKVGWQGLFADIKRWRVLDKELELLLNDRKGSANPNGRPRFDLQPENCDWMIKFCEEYLKERSKVKAASVTPYSPEHLIKMLNPKDTSFNQKFADMVDVCDVQLLEGAKKLVWDAVDEAQAPNSGLSAKDKAWIGVNVAKIAKGTDWNQQKMDISLSGHIKFEAQRAKVTAELVADQRSHFQKMREPLMIDSGMDENQVIDLLPLPEKVAN